MSAQPHVGSLSTYIVSADHSVDLRLSLRPSTPQLVLHTIRRVTVALVGVFESQNQWRRHRTTMPHRRLHLRSDKSLQPRVSCYQ